MTNKQENLVKEALSSTEVCNEWKAKIRTAFPKVIEDIVLKKGTWYSFGSEFIVYYLRPQGNYGLNMNGEWMENALGTANMQNFVEMSKEEIEVKLIKEAKRRCLEKYARLKTQWCKFAFTMNGTYEFDIKNNILWAFSSDLRGKCTIFDNGVWASNPGISIKDAELKLGVRIIE